MRANAIPQRDHATVSVYTSTHCNIPTLELLLQIPLKNRIFLTKQMALEMSGTEPGAAAMPRSIVLASIFAQHRATRSMTCTTNQHDHNYEIEVQQCIGTPNSGLRLWYDYACASPPP
jgi:hypothetical protein